MKLLLITFLCIINISTVFGEIDINNLSPYVHPPILTPIPDGVKQEIPEELGNKKLANMGLVDVTAEPFNADPTAKKIQQKRFNMLLILHGIIRWFAFFLLGHIKFLIH